MSGVDEGQDAMNVTSIAATGMSAAIGRFERSAAAIAKVEAKVEAKQDAKAELAKVDLVKEAVEAVSAKTELKANAAVARTGSRMGAMLDVLV